MNRSVFQNWDRQNIIPYISPPLAASLAIIPCFYGFQLKSSFQTDFPISRFCFKQNLVNSLRAAPTIGAIVGTQTGVQRILEKKYSKYSSNGKTSVVLMTGSSLLIAVISVIPMAIFNGQTLGYSPLQSLKKISIKQSSAIVAREASFLFSLRISEPISSFVKRKSDDHRLVHVANFFIGAFGGIIGHPADTALTRWQKGLSMSVFTDSMKGIYVRSLTMGAFTVLYTEIKEKLANL